MASREFSVTMAESDREHLIEVRSGVGEPPTMQFQQGHEVGPLALGRQGTWRISALGVLDVHGYLYFNGQQLFLQSTDRRSPITFKGTPVKLGEWTGVKPPGAI